MLPAIVHKVRAKVPRGLPSLLSAVLAAFVVAEGVRLTQQLVLLVRGTSGNDTSEHAPPVAVPTTDNIDLRAIIAAHLFGAPEAPPPAVNTDPNGVPASTSSLSLTGTLASRDPKRGMAIITADGKSAIYAVGVAVGGATVSSVYADRIILDRGGVLEALLMPHAKPPSGPAAQVADATVGNPSPGPGDLVPDDSSKVSDVMRAGGPVMNAAGHMRGFRIYPGRDRAAFLAAGLHGGDVLVAFNGTPVLAQNSQDQQAVFQSFGTAGRATLTVERNGQTRDVEIDVAQAASSMRQNSTASPPQNIQPTSNTAFEAATSVHDESP